jgi:uncharacterized membrane protein YbaN (DUF454 family)
MGIILWRTLVLIFLLLALIGILLPGLPTTVFLILAAWAASKGWPKMDVWLLNHPKYGESLRLWRAEGSVPRKVKYMASAMMLLSALIILFTAVPWWFKLLIYAILLLVLMWLWCRPEPSSTKQS